MIRRLVLILVAALMAAFIAVAADAPVSADHDNECQTGIISETRSPDAYVAFCEGLWKGWVQVSIWCYRRAPLIVDGEIIRTYRSYVQRTGPAVFKPWYVPSLELNIHCLNYRPFIEKIAGLDPKVDTWHGSD